MKLILFRTFHSLIILTIVLFLSSCSDSVSKKEVFYATKGFLDLKNWDYHRDPIIPLDGDWEFYWKEFYSKDEIPNQSKEQIDYMLIPSDWNGKMIGTTELTGEGYATYRLNINLPENLYEEISINISRAPESFVLFANGKKILQHGKPGKSELDSIPSYDNGLGSFIPESRNLELILHVSNFRVSRTGVPRSILIGTSREIQSQSKFNFSNDLIMIGCFLMMGIYHVGLFLFRSKNLSALFLGLFALNIALRTSLLGEVYLLTLFPDLPFELCVRMEYFTYYSGMPVFISFLHFMFPENFNRKILYFFIILCAPLILSCFLFSIETLTYVLNYAHFNSFLAGLFALYVLTKSNIEKRKGAKLISIGVIILVLTTFNDILFSRRIVNTGHFFSIAFVVFLFFQAFSLSRLFMSEIKSAENLGRTIAKINPKLKNNKAEDIIIYQAKEIETSSKELRKLGEIAREINSDLNIENIFNKVVFYFKEIYNFEYFTLNLVDKSKNQMIVRMSNVPDETMQKIIPTGKISLSPELGATWLTFQRKKTLYVPNIDFFRKKKLTLPIDELIADTLDLKSFIYAPLIIKNEVIGIISLFSKDIKKFTARQVGLIQTFTDQIAGAVYNAILLENTLRAKQITELEKIKAQKAFEMAETEKAKIDQVREELEKLNEFLNKINSMKNLLEILEEMFGYLEKEFRFDFSWLVVVDEKNKAFRSSYHNKKNIRFSDEAYQFLKNFETSIENSQGILNQIYKKKRLIYGWRIPAEKYLSEIDKIFIDKLKFKSFLGLPLIIQNRVIGILLFNNYDSNISLKREELKKIERFCSQVANALNNTMLLEELQREKINSESAKEKINTLNEFSKRINSTDELDLILEDIFNYVKEKYKFESMMVLLKHHLKNEFYNRKIFFSEDFSLSQKKLANTFRFSLNEKEGGLHYAVFKKQEPFYLPKIRISFANHQERLFIESIGLKSVLIVPLIVNKKTIGLLDFTNFKNEMNLNSESLNDISIFREQIASAVHNLSILSWQKEENVKLEKLLYNVLPVKIADELKEKGKVEPEVFKEASLMYVGFDDLEEILKEVSYDELFLLLDQYFSRIDRVLENHGIERIKPSGNGYICGSGIPVKRKSHAIDTSLAALEIIALNQKNSQKINPIFQSKLRVRIHSGQVVAGIIGENKQFFDVWGESIEVLGQLNQNKSKENIIISAETYQLVKDFFDCKKYIDNPIKTVQYILLHLKSEFIDERKPGFLNRKFFEKYSEILNEEVTHENFEI